jgi:hypothetical protein
LGILAAGFAVVIGPQPATQSLVHPGASSEAWTSGIRHMVSWSIAADLNDEGVPTPDSV